VTRTPHKLSSLCARSHAKLAGQENNHVILGKFWGAIRAQINKIANMFWEADPIAQMQYEHDVALEQLKEGRKGLEMYRGLVERFSRQAATSRAHVQKLESETKAYLKSGQRDVAAKFALELQKAKKELATHEEQLQMHETAYENNLKKIKHASGKLADVRTKIQKYDAELKMSAAEAEIAALAESFDMNITTDFGQIEQVIQARIDKSRGKARVAADLSAEGVQQIEAEEQMQKAMAEDALAQFEVELGLRSPETTKVPETQKDLGPAVAGKVTSTETN
jgi:phage shock protein A